MKQVRANYPHQELSTETAKVWMKQWAEFASQAGVDVLWRALWRCMSESDFLPQPSAVSRAIKAIIKSEQLSKDRAKQPIQDCATCNNMRMIPGEEMRDGRRVRVARECNCIKEWRAQRQPILDRKSSAAGERAAV